MFDVKDIYSLTDFNRNTKVHIERVRATGRPHILTVNGKASVVVQDADAYQKLLEDLDLAESVKALRRRLQSLNRGRKGIPMRKAVEDFALDVGVDLNK